MLCAAAVVRSDMPAIRLDIDLSSMSKTRVRGSQAQSNEIRLSHKVSALSLLTPGYRSPGQVNLGRTGVVPYLPLLPSVQAAKNRPNSNRHLGTCAL